MVLYQFPDLGWLKKQAEESFASRQSWTGDALQHKGWPNVILNVSTKKTLRDNIRGPLSIFTNISGLSAVEVSDRRVQIREEFFFVSNQDQHYTLEIDQKKPAETFNIHFGAYFVDQVFASVTTTTNQLLEQPTAQLLERIEFHNKLYYRDADFRSLLLQIRNQPHPIAPGRLEEQLFELVVYLLANEKGLKKIRENIPGLKASTREEIFRRLLAVEDYILSNLEMDLTLDALASIGCLSKFHFLRLFKSAFGKTPYQFINAERIRTSKQLITKTRLEIHEIARLVGFDNPSSFSRMFHHEVGLYPMQLRQRI